MNTKSQLEQIFSDVFIHWWCEPRRCWWSCCAQLETEWRHEHDTCCVSRYRLSIRPSAFPDRHPHPERCSFRWTVQEITDLHLFHTSQEQGELQTTKRHSCQRNCARQLVPRHFQNIAVWVFFYQHNVKQNHHFSVLDITGEQVSLLCDKCHWMAFLFWMKVNYFTSNICTFSHMNTFSQRTLVLSMSPNLQRYNLLWFNHLQKSQPLFQYWTHGIAREGI